MKISELINKLQSLKEKHGDNELLFLAKDWFSTYGETMHTGLKCGESTRLPTDWNDVATNRDANLTTITFHIDHKEGKKPKITFRS